ncbi:ABC transporter permease [Actinocatenispora rupis]|uniref:Peptide ABC transporter permease n=1 Tax=Actinocatenispora rupis TaxID=519421 RepID=A0A8J3NCF6_9ACTN|nr:ABC transporter permease [Actinocatenispora rupis]GID14284.1 peptide ABC transporter permease [Actinocatenispora rupis]
MTATLDAPRVRLRTKGKPGGVRIVGSLAVVCCYALCAVFGPMLFRFDPVAVDTRNRLLAPMSHTSAGDLVLFGTDQVGQDLLAKMMQGARVSMTIGISALLLSGLIGLVFGVLAGYFGGPLDSLLMRLADIQLAFPGILLAILIAAVLGPSVTNVIVVLSVSGWVTFARVVRGQVLATKRREYVDATRTLGARHWHIVRTCILPACRAPFLVIAALHIGDVILAEAALSFLGLGTPVTTPSWGTTIASGRDLLGTAWWISALPGIGLAVLVVAFGVLGDALRDRFDPKLAGR